MPTLLARLSLGLAALGTLGLGGCADEPAPPAAPPVIAEDARPSADASERRPGAGLDRILADRPDDAAFLSGLRTPRHRTAAPVTGGLDPDQADSVVTMVYDGLLIEAYAAAGRPTRVRRVSVTGGGYGTASGLSVGETRASIETVLGPPGRRATEPGVETYPSVSGPRGATVTVTYDRDEDGVERASQMVWSIPID